VLVTAAIALDAHEAVFKQSALEVVLELLANELRQAGARSFDFLNEVRIVLLNESIEYRLIRPVTNIANGWAS